MRFINGTVFGGDFRFHKGDFEVKDGRFLRVDRAQTGRGENPESPAEKAAAGPETLDLKGALVLPGLIDVHFHGGAGVDFTEGDYEGLKKTAAWLAKNGVSSFSIASITQAEEVLAGAYRNGARLAAERPAGCARIAGITMEGPFFCKEKKGAQPEQHLKAPDLDLLGRLAQAAGGLLKIVCVAPELPGAMDFIEKAAADYRVSLGHTAAGYDISREAIRRGASQVTHLYNAMLPFHHREPGLIGAAADDERVSAELICDGVHVHESAVRAAFRLFGAERIILISDCLSACGGEEGGTYTSGGEAITLKNGAAVLSDGATLAGSATPLFECMRRAVSFGIPLEDAVRAATANAAKSIGTLDESGTIEEGKRADFLICDSQLNLKQVYVDGKPMLPVSC